MSRIAYVNGRYVPHAHAFVHMEDRGYQFADGVYEYIAFYNDTFLDLEPHIRRLYRSLKALSIPAPVAEQVLPLIMRELISRNSRRDGGLYLQVTRGVARRDHPFPKNTRPSLTMTICAAKVPKAHELEKGVSVITYPEQRWARCDIKSVGLLANVLAKQEATAHAAREAWLLLPDGTVTEGAVSNAYIITREEGIVTHPANHCILGGVTRDEVLQFARKNGIHVTERPFTIEEALNAPEAFLTSTSAGVLPVTSIDGKKVGSGAPGDVTRKLMQLFSAHVLHQTGKIL